MIRNAALPAGVWGLPLRLEYATTRNDQRHATKGCIVVSARGLYIKDLTLQYYRHEISYHLYIYRPWLTRHTSVLLKKKKKIH